MDKKRERAQNFSKTETKLLLDLVTKFKSVIENKKTDSVTNKEKEAAWGNIANTFNAINGGTASRSSKTLKLKYESLKKNTKKKMSRYRQDQYRTGGGPPPKAPEYDEVEENILAICTNLTGLEARNDSDHITTYENKPASPFLGVNVQESEIVIIDSCNTEPETNFNTEPESNYNTEPETKPNTESAYEVEIVEDHNWSTWNPKELKSKINPVLKPNKVTINKKIDEVQSARLELIKLQHQIAQQEHAFAAEEHKLKIKHLENEEKRKVELHNLTLNSMRNT